jgi:amidase
MVTFAEYRNMDATALAEAIAKGDLGAAEVLETAIARAEAVNPKINAIVHDQFDQARQTITDDTAHNGPFKGVPYLLKDLGAFDTGQPCTMGSRLWADFVPDHDATYTERCKAAGFVILGRTNTPELGLNASTEPTLHGATREPLGCDAFPWRFVRRFGSGCCRRDFAHGTRHGWWRFDPHSRRQLWPLRCKADTGPQPGRA